MKQCQGDWSKEQIKELLKARKVTRNDTLGSIYEDEEDANAVLKDKTGLAWWLREFMGSKEMDITVEERMKYSVGRGMVVFGSPECLDELAREVYSVKSIVHKFLIGVLSTSLPVSLPYPVLLTLAKLICSSGGASKFGWVSLGKASHLVESKYINRVYLALLDVYNVFREIMFKHAAETLSPNFHKKFTFLRSSLARNLTLVESFHQATFNEDPLAEKIFYKELKTVNITMEPSKLSEIIFKTRNPLDRLMVSGDNVFTVQAKRQGHEAGLFLSVHNLATGDLVKKFSAVPLTFLAGQTVNFCTRLCVLGNLVAISLTHGYPKPSPSSRDLVFVVDWIEEKVVMRQTVKHSSPFVAAVKARREEYYNDDESDHEDIDDYSYEEEYLVNSSLEVSLSIRNDKLFLLHKEVVLPELEYVSELDSWGQYVRIWGLDGEMVQELHDIRVIDLHAGLLIYEEAEDKNSSETGFTRFGEIQVVVKWLDLCSGNIFRVDTGCIKPEYSIARHTIGDTLVLQYFHGHDEITFIKLDPVSFTTSSQKVACPVLTSGGGVGSEVKIQLFADNLIGFSHPLVSPSLEGRLPNNITRWVLARAGSEKLLAEVFIANANLDDEDAKPNGHHVLAPADNIVQEGHRMVVMKEKDLKVTLSQYEFENSAIEAITWDETIANTIVEKVEIAKKVVEEQKAHINILEVLAMERKRVTGSLVNWCGSFGFLRLHDYPDASNVFVHISKIRQPRPFLTPGIKMEVSLEKDFVKNKVRGVAARVLFF